MINKTIQCNEEYTALYETATRKIFANLHYVLYLCYSYGTVRYYALIFIQRMSTYLSTSDPY